MIRMTTDLRDTVTRAILGHFPAPSHNDNDDYAEADEYACAALAALGLDDLDAAAERLVRFFEGGMFAYDPEGLATPEVIRGDARNMLRALFSHLATDGSEA